MIQTDRKRPVGRPRKAARIKICTTLPPDLLEEMKEAAEERGMTLNAAIEFSIRRWLTQIHLGL